MKPGEHKKFFQKKIEEEMAFFEARSEWDDRVIEDMDSQISFYDESLKSDRKDRFKNYYQKEWYETKLEFLKRTREKLLARKTQKKIGEVI